jgi:peptidyl-tRNA hydrolase
VLSYPISIESKGKSRIHAAERIMTFSVSHSFLNVGNERGKVIYRSRRLRILTCCTIRQTKVALRCSDEEELLLLQAKAQSLNLCARTIQDA